MPDRLRPTSDLWGAVLLVLIGCGESVTSREPFPPAPVVPVPAPGDAVAAEWHRMSDWDMSTKMSIDSKLRNYGAVYAGGRNRAPNEPVPINAAKGLDDLDDHEREFLDRFPATRASIIRDIEKRHAAMRERDERTP
jgi:hypothetical protein